MSKRMDPELKALGAMSRAFAAMPSRSAQARSAAWLADRFSREASDILYYKARQFRSEEETVKDLARIKGGRT